MRIVKFGHACVRVEHDGVAVVIDPGVFTEVGAQAGAALRIYCMGIATGDYDGRPTLNFLAVGRIEGEPKAADDSLELRWWPLDRLPPLAWPHEADFVKRLRQL